MALALAGSGLAADTPAATPAAPATPAAAAAELIQKGNVFYDKLQPAEALKYYLPAEKLGPDNVELLVRIARQYRHLMSEAGVFRRRAALARWR